MGVPVISLPDDLILGRGTHGFFDDFYEFTSGDEWTSIESDSGSSTSLQQSVGGQLDIIAGTTNENEVYLYRTAETFLTAEDKPMVFEARISWAEINTDDSNVIFGAWNAVAANDLADAGAGPRSSPATDGFMFFKEDGQTLWSVESSDGADAAATRTTTQLTALNSDDGVDHTAAPGATTWQTLRIEASPQSSTKQDVAYFIDGTLVKKHNMSYTTPTEMTVCIGAKCGSANTLTVQIDYIGGYQVR